MLRREELIFWGGCVLILVIWYNFPGLGGETICLWFQFIGRGGTLKDLMEFLYMI